ncbi:MAG: SNF2-related protein [Acidobacteriota bacterium]|nr:SNF2-related protein [Acidobacteriota bacterium]
MWKVGDRVRHRFNPELGPGLVESVSGRTISLFFPTSGSRLQLAASTDALTELVLRVGVRAAPLDDADGGPGIVMELTEDGFAVLDDGRRMAAEGLWPIQVGDSLFERLAVGDVGRMDAFAMRLEMLHLTSIREADGLGSFLGGRIQLFPHQLHVAERATQADPVRWLLADEVGLGKTVEACLILNYLVRTRRADRALVVAPDTLTVQWLGELWRKYHQVFVLLDDERLEDVEREYGKGFNPFDAHDQVVVSLERLAASPRLVEQAIEAEIDLLVVDEAHHLRRKPGHPGNPAYRAVRQIADQGRHLLLLSATPLEEDAHGFFRLLQLLRPDEFPEDQSFDERLEKRTPLPPCTSATRRDDIGGLPPRRPQPVDWPGGDAWPATESLLAVAREGEPGNALERIRKIERIRLALDSPWALAQSVPAKNPLRAPAVKAGKCDGRLDWLVRNAGKWAGRGEKTLVFVSRRESLDAIRTEMSRQSQLRVGVFHEDLSAAQRDIEVAQFQLKSGPSMLVSTECGGEGRNFQFCTRLVLFDLPWNPMVVEQRIGRLDRIGRDRPVDIVYFRPPDGLARGVVELFEQLGLFEKPLGGLERELAGVADAIGDRALAGRDADSDKRFATLAKTAQVAWDRVQEAAYHELHRDPYDESLAQKILDRVPPDLEELTEDVLVAACGLLDLRLEPQRRASRYSFEYRKRSRVESLPGVPAGSSFLGTFEREVAVTDDNIDFFASGHPLVEGMMAHLEESPLGRVAVLDVADDEGTEGIGLAALYRTDDGFRAEAVDLGGKSRPEWASLLTRRPFRSRRIPRSSLTGQPGWPTLVRTLAPLLEAHGNPIAVAALRVSRRPERKSAAGDESGADQEVDQ